MRKKEFRKITGILMVIALFACIFTYRVYADEPEKANDPETQENSTQNGNSTADSGNQEDKKEEEKKEGESSQPADTNGGDASSGSDENEEGAKSAKGETDTKGDGSNGGETLTSPNEKKAAGDAPASTTDTPAPEAKGEGTDGTETNKNEETPQSHEVGDFIVTGDENNFNYENGILTITGDVSVRNRDGVEVTDNSIIVNNNATVTLEGVNIVAAVGPGIMIESPYNVTLVLADDSVNKVVGANGHNINATSGDFAGIEVGFVWQSDEQPKNEMASLIIEGNGTLYATSNSNGAGIGGSNSSGDSRGYGLYGNITINSGTIIATSPGSGAGIGSSNNPKGGTSIGSYKTTGNNIWGTITINGGNVTAESKGSGAGIGGGNHVDSGKIIINGGTVIAKGHAGIGCGVGSSKNDGNGGDKGPGYYWADVEINGGDIIATATSDDNWGGAGIGGGGYADAIVKITGGTIHAYGGSCGNGHNAYHHGGAGIGAGYEGHADVTITGGTIYAYAGYSAAAGIGSGGAPNSHPNRGTNGINSRSTNEGVTKLKETIVTISGGDIHAFAYPQYEYDSERAILDRGGAGIGGGNGADKVTVTITGGTIEAWGSPSNENDKNGGAGIGSGLFASGLQIPAANKNESSSYHVETNVDISITGGKVLAVGGWGASGIGSGAKNKMANTITLDNTKADIEAYADGTKFAIDTRDLLADGTTNSHREGRTVDGYILQGTFVHNYIPKDESGHTLVDDNGAELNQKTEGLNDIKIIDDMTGARERRLTKMPVGYRSFAATVSKAGTYTVYTDSEAISNGGGRYFAEYWKDVIDESYWSDRDDQSRFVQYEAKDHELCDNFYLYPVKSIVVDKEVVREGDLKAEDLNTTVYFAIREKRLDANGNKDESEELFIKKDGEKWIQSIKIINGVPQNKVYFTNVEDKTYEILEVDENGKLLKSGIAFGETILKSITTRHGDGTDNDGVISKTVWTDRVTVINTYYKDSKIDLVIRKILPTEYKFDEYNGTTVIFKVTVKDSDGNQTYENYAGISLDSDSARYDKELGYVYEKTLKDIPFNSTDTLDVEEVYSAGYLGTVSQPVLVTSEDAKYYRVDTVNEVNEYVPGTGAVNSYHDKTHVSRIMEGGGQ